MAISTEQENLELMSIEEEARASGMLHLSYRGLTHLSLQYVFPQLIRLDLGHNQIQALPSQVGMLTSLEELWISDNPLLSLPEELGNCAKLKVLDLSRTLLSELPSELGKLQQIVEVGLEETPNLTPEWQSIYEEGGTQGLVSFLKHNHERKLLKIQLAQDFREGLYREEADDPVRCNEIVLLVEKVFEEFTDHGELKSLIRNQDRLFPTQINRVNLEQIRKKFISLREENERKMLAASLELKLRAIYYDRIDPTSVEGIVKSIYAEIESLEDMQFLIKHASKLFPEEVADIDARRVFQTLLSFRKDLEEKRAAAISVVDQQLRLLYSHLEPKVVKELTDSVCVFFKKVEDLKQLAADAAIYFPSEFEQAITDPRAIRLTYVQKQKEKDDG